MSLIVLLHLFKLRPMLLTQHPLSLRLRKIVRLLHSLLWEEHLLATSQLYYIIPSQDLTYDLGSNNARFRDLYLSGNTSNLGGTKIGKDSNMNIRITDSADNLKRIIVEEIQIGDANTGSNALR